jgi:outer membrane protein assembly factor BamB
MTMTSIRLLAIACVSLSAAVAQAGDWPAFRGTRHDGVSEEQDVPTEWSATTNVVWKADLPRPANGSPIVVADKVLVTSAEDTEGKQRSLYCFGRKTGAREWVRTVEFERTMPTHETNPFCGTTPASDGRRVVVWHASAGLHCYDLEGNELWKRDLGEFQHMWGYGSSPIFQGNKVILFTGPSKDRSFVAAFDADNGDTIWEVDEPYEGDGDHNAAGKYMGSWSTPIVAEVGDRPQLILMLPTRVNAYDVASGAMIWTCDGLNHEQGDLAYSSPILAGDLCMVTGGFRGPAMAIRLGGKGNVTESHRLWRTEKNPQSIGSGVYIRGFVYRPNAGPGTIECLDPTTGEVRWEDRGSGAEYWASIVAAGGHLYATDRDGTTTVFQPDSEKFRPIAVNRLEDSCHATPAISGKQIFIRTARHLFCIGKAS